MKKAFFFVFILLSFQGFAQVKTGVYSVNETVDFEWSNGEQVGDYTSNSVNLIHITDWGFRIYKQSNDTGNSFSSIYIGVDSHGYHCYAVPFGDRLEVGEDLAVLFYNFNNKTGWYENSTEWRGLEYISNVPILDYEK